MAETKLSLIGFLFFVLVFLTQGILFIQANSQTVDEAMHLAAGYSYLIKRDFRIEPQNPPLIKELLALPVLIAYRLPFHPDPQHWRDADGYLIGQDLLYRSTPTAEQILALSRFPNLFLGGVLVALIGWWAYRLWGNRAALLAMGLASFEPNLIAHSSLVTTDIGVTMFIFLTMYLFWEYVNHPTWRLLVGIGVSTGMALAAKFSAVLVLPIIALIVSVSLLTRSGLDVPLPKKLKPTAPRHKLLEATAVLSLIGFVATLVISSAYLFQGFQLWLSGFYQFLTLSQEGLPAFFLGEYSWHNWWSYFPVVFLLKTPLGSLVIITISLVFHRTGSPLAYRQALFLVLPVILIFLAMTQAKTNIGLRHILPVYPFLFVLASRVVTLRFYRYSITRFLIGIPVAWMAISSLRVAPHHLAYFNELAGGPEQGYRYLSDSNVDWGQDLKGLKAYVEREKLPIIYLSYFGTAPPSYYNIRYQDVASKGILEPHPHEKVPTDAPRKILAISVYNLQNVSSPDDPFFRWLHAREPIAKIGYSIFVYDLTDDREGLRKLEEITIHRHSAASIRTAKFVPSFGGHAFVSSE